MTDRERFQKIMRYEPVDRLPVFALEPFERPAIERWRREGLPADKTPIEFLRMAQFDRAGGIGISPVPEYEKKVLFEDADYLVETTGMGTTLKRCKSAPTTFYGHVDHPIKTRVDWDRYKERLDPNTPERSRYTITPADARRLNASENPVSVCLFPFFFRFGFYTMGMERFLTTFHIDDLQISDHVFPNA